MNVMAKAHQMVKALIAKLSPSARYVGQYAQMLKVALKQAHKEFKAMQNNPVQRMIDDAQAYIEELKAADQQGFIIVVGEYRTCVNAEVGHTTNVIKAPIYMNLDDAKYYAARVKNGLGESGEVVGKFSQLKFEIEQQEKLIERLKESL